MTKNAWMMLIVLTLVLISGCIFNPTLPDVCVDGDGDGFGDPANVNCDFPELDCDDSLNTTYPGAEEVCGNEIDNDCDELVDCDDSDCDADSNCVVDPIINETNETREPYLGWVYNLDNLPEGDPRDANGALCPTLTWPAPVVDDEFIGAESNPTGEPIGGFFGYSRIVKPEDADYFVETTQEFLDTLEVMQSGEIMYIDDDAVIDLYGVWNIYIPEGVTIASGRGRDFSQGALIQNLERPTHDSNKRKFLRTDGPNVRITGLRIIGGEHSSVRAQHRAIHSEKRPDLQGTYYDIVATSGINSNYGRLEVDNIELAGWQYAGIALFLNSIDNCIHHNYIHNNIRKGLGYGVSMGVIGTNEGDQINFLAEGNIFNANRHSLASPYYEETSYEARYNLQLGNQIGHDFDRHGSGTATGNYAGGYTLIHHNTFWSNNSLHYSPPDIGIRGISIYEDGILIYNNWFYKNELDSVQTPIMMFNETGRTYSVDNMKNMEAWNNYIDLSAPEGVSVPVVVVDISDTQVVVGQEISLSAKQSYDSDDDISFIEVDFVDNEGSDFGISEYGLPEKVFTHTYSKPGRYPVHVKAFNDKGIFSEEFYDIVVAPASDNPALSFWIRDTYKGDTSGFFVKEALINEEVIWSEDISGDIGWEHVVLDLSDVPFSSGDTITIRVRAINDFVAPIYPETNSIESFEIHVDDVELFGGSINDGGFEHRYYYFLDWEYNSVGSGWLSESPETKFLAKHGGETGLRLSSKFWTDYAQDDLMGMSININ